MSDCTTPSPREVAARYVERPAATTRDREVAEIAVALYQGDQLGRLAVALVTPVSPASAVALQAERDAALAQVAAVRALCVEAMKLPTREDPRPADDFVSPRAVLAALDGAGSAT